MSFPFSKLRLLCLPLIRYPFLKSLALFTVLPPSSSLFSHVNLGRFFFPMYPPPQRVKFFPMSAGMHCGFRNRLSSLVANDSFPIFANRGLGTLSPTVHVRSPGGEFDACAGSTQVHPTHSFPSFRCPLQVAVIVCFRFLCLATSGCRTG